MEKEDKRGLSTIIATLLIILLVIVAVTIVWAVVKNLITKGSEDITLDKFTINLEIVSIKQTTNDVSVKVRRNPGEGDLEGIIFAIFDGEETHLREVKNISLLPLETKTFVLNYQGEIVSISIYPLFLTQSGKISQGDISDTYSYSGEGVEEGYVDPGCIPNCAGKTLCEDNGCGDDCGLDCSGNTPYCINGVCEGDTGGIEGSCECAETICEGTTCDNGLGEPCYGLIEMDCTDSEGDEIMCGTPQNTECNFLINGCGTCATGDCYLGICCPDGYHSIDGINCVIDCDPIANCLGKECGSNGCVGGGTCPPGCNILGPTWFCNLSQLCEECTRDCGTRECGPEPTGCGENCGICVGEDCGNCTREYGTGYECNITTGMCQMCTPICGTRECGPEPDGCGFCGDYDGECENINDECIDGECIPPEARLNWGKIASVWPINVGKIFDSGDLNRTVPDGYFNNYWVKFPGSDEGACLQIERFVIPNSDPDLQEIYNMSYVRLLTYSSDIKPDDNYEIWETYEGCTS